MANLLKSILDDEFLETLAKSADLYKIGTNTVLDPEEIRIGLKVVPRAVMSLLISELVPMEVNAHKDIRLPFGKEAFIRVNKKAADDFTGSVYSDNKLVYDFKNRSIPGLGIILLSTFELYDMDELSKPHEESVDVDKKVQKLIDERMELHSLVGRVVEEKLAQREAIHKIMMAKLGEVLSSQKSRHNGEMMAEPIATKGVAIPSIATKGVAIPSIATKPLDIEPEDIAKKEAAPRKGSPLKDFIARKKPKEHSIEILKGESRDCDSCGQTIFGDNGFNSCVCFGENMGSKISLKKKEDGTVSISFSRSWTPENIEILLQTLRSKNGKK